MGQVVKLNFSRINKYENNVYKDKLIRIRDEIEDYLCQISIYESDELAIALAAGRYGTMKLAQLTGETDTKNFLNECIKTSLNN